MKLLFTAFFLPFMFAWPASAAFEDLDAGPRASAMSGAYAAQSDGISSIFYNPAGIIGVTRYEASLAQQKLHLGLTDGSSLMRSAIAFGAPLEFGGAYWGSAAFGLDTLSLDSLYSESRFRIGWAYPLKKNIWVGAALARLSITYGEDTSAPANPVLAASEGAAAMGLDLGAIYSMGSADLGLSIQNANVPDLGIKYENKVDRKITMGLALKRQSFTWDTDLSMSGSDMKIKTGAELPVMREKFGDRALARAGFSFGSRDYRAISAGFGYRKGFYRVEYAFSYPLSGLSGTMGSHQLGVLVAWGEARGPMSGRDTQYASEDQEKKKIGGTGAEVLPPEKTEPTSRDLEKAEKILQEARNNLRIGAYSEAHVNFKKADELLMGTDKEVRDSLQKVAAVSSALPEAVSKLDRDDILRKSVNRYMYTNTDAVLYITYARQKWPRDAAVARLYNLLAREFPQTASEMRILPGITIVDQLLQDALDFIRSGHLIQAISKLQQVLQLEPDNIPALTRMGSAYWAMDKKDIARSNWQRVLDMDPGNTEVLQFMKMN